MTSCTDCKNHPTNGGACSLFVSSNGHTTWRTPLFKGEDWEVVTGGDAEKLLAAQPDGEGGMDCNGWNPAQVITININEFSDTDLYGVWGDGVPENLVGDWASLDRLKAAIKAEQIAQRVKFNIICNF